MPDGTATWGDASRLVNWKDRKTTKNAIASDVQEVTKTARMLPTVNERLVKLNGQMLEIRLKIKDRDRKGGSTKVVQMKFLFNIEGCIQSEGPYYIIVTNKYIGIIPPYQLAFVSKRRGDSLQTLVLSAR